MFGATGIIYLSPCRRLVLLTLGLLLCALQLLSGQSWYSSSWKYRQEITIVSNHGDFNLGGNLTDFPVLIKITGVNALFGRAQSDGDDILFTSSDGTTKIPHEIENYSDTGPTELWAWVKAPTFYSGSVTVLYLYYGNASTSSQEDAENVWDSGYQLVMHLNEQVVDESTGGLHYDSTSNNYTGAQQYNAYTSSGKISGAQVNSGVRDGDTLLDAGAALIQGTYDLAVSVSATFYYLKTAKAPQSIWEEVHSRGAA